MTSNFISRFAGYSNPSGSIYDAMRQHDEGDSDSDIERRAGAAAGGRNLQTRYHDLESVDTNPHHPAASDFAVVAEPRRSAHMNASGSKKEKGRNTGRPKWSQRAHKLLDVEEADDDVPASLLIEDNVAGRGQQPPLNLPPPPSSIPDPFMDLDDDEPSARHGSGDARRRRRSRGDGLGDTPSRIPSGSWWQGFASSDPKGAAEFRWVNVTNLDNFLHDVYIYYVDHGFWSTILRRLFTALTFAFIVGSSIFLTQCVRYSDIRGSTKLDQILVEQCVGALGTSSSILLWLLVFAWVCLVANNLRDIPRLRHMHDFYLYLLDIPESEIQSISWQEVVSRLMTLRDANPTVASDAAAINKGFLRTQSKQRMDAHDIANRLMRQENYMIAMINKDVLDVTLPIPFLRNRHLYTRTLEWYLKLCIFQYVFNDRGQVRQLFLKDTHRRALSEGLQRRFIIYGLSCFLVAPFLITFNLIRHFFENFNDYQKNPGQIGLREYNPLARWKFREFNELEHLFDRRINMSIPFADRYINQFPKDKTAQAARFVAFVSGAVVAVLGVATILDQENFLSFEITTGRTTIFYLGVFGSIWAVSRGMLPDDNIVYDTAYSIQEVIEFTHYQPAHWEGRLHTIQVKTEFAQYYQMRIVIFFEELLSMIFTPFVLCFSLPKCSDRIIDFFREFTVHVDGIGYVCSFAEFNFMKPGIKKTAASTDKANAAGTAAPASNLREDYFSSKDNKLEQSYWGFMNDYARNPKADVRFPYHSRRRFNMPPPVPGLPSPIMPSTSDHMNQYNPPSLSSPRRANFGGTPGLSAQPTSMSPLQSMLLDPHHQPSASGFASASPKALRPRGVGGSLIANLKASRLPSDLVEEAYEGQQNAAVSRMDTAAPATIQSQIRLHAAGESAGEGELGSWKLEDESEESGEEDVGELTGRGPLGLMMELKKAREEVGRGGM